MNAEQEIERLLAASNAVLVRHNKHLVYRLPNGQTFVMAKTPGDPDRAARNSLSDLRRALGIARQPLARQEEPAMQIEEVPAPAPQPPAVEPIEQNNLKSRIEAAITVQENQQERLMAEAQAFDRRVQLLRALLPFAEDPSAEAALMALVPPPKPEPMVSVAQAPPERITERVQVTRQLVLAATQTFNGTFTVNDIMARMTGNAMIDGAERLRVRSAIASAMMALLDRGEVIRETAGYGRRQAIWKKAALMSPNL